ncbi:MAG: tripartite tricarboxylate transporter substrate binding protein [Rhodospirillales bacterium]|nr:tripartite tricarboxylate transporter substrate binding protein [Rhodospirillales bacterium]
MQTRRCFLRFAATAAALPLASRAGFAADYPTRPVRIIVGYPAGGTADIVSRVLAQWLSECLGQQFVVENRPGAGGNLGTEAVVTAAPDGHTLLMADPSATIGAAAYDKLNFNFIRDIAPVASIGRIPLVMLVNPSFPAKTVAEFISYAKAHPSKINMASGGTGTITHIGGELFMMMTGVKLLHVPYRGAQFITGLLGGQVDVVFGILTASLSQIKAGGLRALAVTTAARSAALPDVPAVGEFVPGFEASSWGGICAPKSTPVEIITKLNKEINAGLADPQIMARLTDLGNTLVPGTPGDFGKFIADDTAKWAKVVKTMGIKLN